ncbi:Bgt-51069 [Blumeria graminis f. sp. tritici]|uniref:Bgt-51069 n=1 Tax=Blumeria graminis f. sp. tritici TaxID=62690 RepID=A0A9X9PR85_BLUGR|nr:Bgt-51069 [Blumeria graminis f. sp. tritici]
MYIELAVGTPDISFKANLSLFPQAASLPFSHLVITSVQSFSNYKIEPVLS